MRKQRGRCPDCGEAVLVEVTKGKPAEVSPHGCRSRVCEYPGCRVKELLDEMVQLAGSEWYCPRHGLLLVANDLVSLWRGPSADEGAMKCCACRGTLVRPQDDPEAWMCEWCGVYPAYPASMDADGTTISEIIGKILPDLVAKAEAWERRKAS